MPTNPPLPSSLIARIKEYAMNFFPPMVGNSATTKIQIQNRVKYEEKITQYASLCLQLRDALDRISSLSNEYPVQIAIDIADKALALFPEGGKEDGV